MLHKKQTTRSAQTAARQTAYVTRYHAPQDFTFPNDFDLSDHGLFLLETIHRINWAEVSLYWVSEDRAKALKPIVEKTLGLQGAEVIGQVVQVLIPKPLKWTENPKKWGQWLLTAAALFGALTVVRDYFTEFFAFPDVVVFAGNLAPTNLHAGDPINIPLEVHNQARLGKAEVRLNAASLRSLDQKTSPATLQLDMTQVVVEAGQKADVHVTGPSPAPHDSRMHRYELEVRSDAKEGLILPHMHVDYRPFTIIIWPDINSRAEAKLINPAIAEVEISLGAGIPYLTGLRGQLTFASAVPLEENGIILMPGNRNWKACCCERPGGLRRKNQFPNRCDSTLSWKFICR